MTNKTIKISFYGWKKTVSISEDIRLIGFGLPAFVPGGGSSSPQEVGSIRRASMQMGQTIL